MIANVLWVDDDVEYIKTLRSNICSLDSNFFESSCVSYDGINITITPDLDSAFDIINNKNNKIDLIILDIELEGGEGHEGYHNKLFYTGVAIPAIVVSAFATTPKRIEEIHAKGISVVIDKWKYENLSKEIATQICRVLNNSTERILFLRNMVEMFRIYNNIIKIENDEKSIGEWLKFIIKNNVSKEKEQLIKNQIMLECIHYSRLHDDHNKGFKHEDL